MHKDTSYINSILNRARRQREVGKSLLPYLATMGVTARYTQGKSSRAWTLSFKRGRYTVTITPSEVRSLGQGHVRALNSFY